MASRPCRFTAAHIPHLLPAHWYQRHLAALTADLTVTSRNNTRLVRRAAALKLAEMTCVGTWADGARLLAIPPGHALSGLKQLRARAGTGDFWERFLAGVEAIAAELDRHNERTDYARRRATLRTWSITPQRWIELTADLPSAQNVREAASVNQKAGRLLLRARLTAYAADLAARIYLGGHRPAPTG